MTQKPIAETTRLAKLISCAGMMVASIPWRVNTA